jgi:nucleoside-diphosphate-sugar epimerase
LAKSLGESHEVAVAPKGDLRDEAFAKQVVEGAEALIHLASLYPDLPSGASEREVLDLATRGTYVLLQAAADAGVRRIILGSTLAFFERYPAAWSVHESWQPHPDVTDAGQLAAYLAEESAKQFARADPVSVICLRLGTVVDDAAVRGQRYDPRWLHVDDAVQAFQRALEVAPASRPPGTIGEPRQGWWVYHIPGGGRHTRIPLGQARGDNGLGYAPTHDFAGSPGADGPLPESMEAEAAGDLSVLRPRERIPSRPIRNVVVFGAGGPLAAATTRVLAPSYRLRLTDLRAIAEIASEAKPQSTGAPLPEVLGPPHEMVQVDVTDLEQVMRACEGMDAIINCTVIRPHPVNAFLVNFLGAYNVMRAAVAHKIRRVVHTGPQLVTNDRPAGYWWDFDVPDDAPPRPSTWLYGHTKYLGQQTVRLFAEAYDLEVPVLLYSSFVNPETARPRDGGVFAMSISWDDAGHAMRRALETPTLGKYSNAKARRLLGWQPRDTLAHLWARRP